jgi:hypothetical protein
MESNRTLLIVQPDAKPLARALAFDYYIAEARTMAEALSYLGNLRFDAVLAEADLGPGVAGHELLRVVATIAPNTRRILIGAGPCAEAHAVLPKPTSLSHVRHALSSSPRSARPGI